MLKWFGEPSARGRSMHMIELLAGCLNADDDDDDGNDGKARTFFGWSLKCRKEALEHDQREEGNNLLAGRVSAECSAQASEGTTNAASLVRHS